jgi:hypothetical protein
MATGLSLLTWRLCCALLPIQEELAEGAAPEITLNGEEGET